MMLQTKCKYLNKKTKMLLLLFILMWSLMGPNVYGKSSTYGAGIVKAAAAVGIGTVADGDGYDANVTWDMKQQNSIKITTTIPTSASISRNDAKNKTLTTTENKGKNNNATIYGHINKNDNNSNKLPQNVAKKELQMLNKTYMKMPQPSTLSSSLSTVTETGITAEKALTPLPPTALLLTAKDQLNETVYKVPKSTEEDRKKNRNNDKKEQKKTRELEMAMEKVNHTIVTNDKDGVDIKNGSEINNNRTFKSSNSKNFKISTADEKDEIKFNINVGPLYKKKYSKAFLQTDFILQFANDFKKISRVTYFTCKSLEIFKTQKNNTENIIYKRHTDIDRSTFDFTARLHSSVPSNLMLKIVYIDHLLQKNRANVNNAMPRALLNRAGLGGSQSTRNTFTNVNWLEQILRPELLRQIIVLNLNCGESSRRLLEMVKSFNPFNFWLFLNLQHQKQHSKFLLSKTVIHVTKYISFAIYCNCLKQNFDSLEKKRIHTGWAI